MLENSFSKCGKYSKGGMYYDSKIHWRHATFLPKGESRENANITVKNILLE
jgi:hypothetical protein